MSASGLRLEVLLVDDDPVIRKSYGNQLRGEGWSVTVAADGYEALQAAQDHEYDVVLLDLRMPYRNGADVLRSLRARAEFASTAVLLLAQPGDADLVDRAMREGADGVFEKARITPRDVVHEIHDLFTAGGRQARNAAPQAQAAAPVPAPVPAATNVPQAVDDIARRFRKGATRAEGEVRATRPGATTTSYSKDPEAAARAVAARVTQRQLTERDRGPPLSTRWMPTLDDESRETSPPAAPLPAPVVEEAPPPPPPPPPAAPKQMFSTVLNRFVGESAKLAAALGLPGDYLCPICRQQIALRLWPDPEMEAGVRGHFYCPRCTGQ